MRRTKTMLLGDALTEFFNRPYVARQLAISKIDELWLEVVGERVARFTTNLRYDNGVLHVSISSSLIRHEIFLQREQLRESLNRAAKSPIIGTVIIR
ncbi:MAG: DUF721 domain-containing protein [Rikenellaceae bacterium]